MSCKSIGSFNTVAAVGWSAGRAVANFGNEMFVRVKAASSLSTEGSLSVKARLVSDVEVSVGDTSDRAAALSVVRCAVAVSSLSGVGADLSIEEELVSDSVVQAALA